MFACNKNKNITAAMLTSILMLLLTLRETYTLNRLSSFQNLRRKGGKFDHRPERPKVLLRHWAQMLKELRVRFGEVYFVLVYSTFVVILQIITFLISLKLANGKETKVTVGQL